MAWRLGQWARVLGLAAGSQALGSALLPPTELERHCALTEQLRRCFPVVEWLWVLALGNRGPRDQARYSHSRSQGLDDGGFFLLALSWRQGRSPDHLSHLHTLLLL